MPTTVAAPSIQTLLERVDCDAFVLIAAMNPCPCGYSGDPRCACTCAPGANCRYHVQVMGPHQGSGFLHEHVAPLRATISAIDIAKITKRLLASSNLGARGHGYGDVDDRFGVESGHRGAPHVLDIQDVAPDLLLKEASLLRENVLPARMVRNDLYGTLLEADHASFPKH
jgi:hypothetical protein